MSSSSIHLPPSSSTAQQLPAKKKMRGEGEESPLRRLWERGGGCEDIWRAHVATKLNDSDAKFFFEASR